MVWSCDLDQVVGWLSRIDGDLSKLSNSHLNAAKLIASRGILVNADELPSILANVSGDLSRLSTEDLGIAINRLQTTKLDVDEYFNYLAKAEINSIDDYFKVKDWSNISSMTFNSSEEFIEAVLADTRNYIIGTDGVLTNYNSIAHFKTRHIDISDSDLQTRAVQAPGSTFTKFSDTILADLATKTFIESHKLQLAHWASNAPLGSRISSNDFSSITINKPLGYGYLYDGVTLSRLDNLNRVQIIFENVGGNKFIPITGFLDVTK